MSALKLQLCEAGKLEENEVDYWLVGSVYNLCFWVKGNRLYIYLPVSNTSVAVVDSAGNYEIYSESCEGAGDLERVLRYTMGVYEDLGDFHRRALTDPLLSDFARVYRGWRLRSTSLWWSLVTATCQQNASFKQGWRILHDIVRVYGKRVLVGGEEILRPPTPLEVLSDPEKLFATGAGFRAKTIINIAKALVNGVVEPLYVEKAPVTDAEKTLRSIGGVGPYTARLALALSTRRYELPPIDKWLRRIVSAVYNVDERYVEELWVEKWGKWSALASIAVTITLDAEPLTNALERIRRRELLPKPGFWPSPVNMVPFCTLT